MRVEYTRGGCNHSDSPVRTAVWGCDERSSDVGIDRLGVEDAILAFRLTAIEGQVCPTTGFGSWTWSDPLG